MSVDVAVPQDRVVLLQASGHGQARRALGRRGEPLLVGRDPICDLHITRDPNVAARHLQLHWRSGEPWIEALAETTLAGRACSARRLEDGDWLRIGDTDLIALCGAPAAAKQPGHARAAQAQRELAGAGFALLDAARDPQIADLVRRSDERTESLYEGASIDLWQVGPLLVELSEPMLDSLLQRGWGRAWGIFLASSRPYAALRRHLRRLLMVDIGQAGKRAYFRFYDPRVLDKVMGLLTPRQRDQFFGDTIERVFWEDERGALREERAP